MRRLLAVFSGLLATGAVAAVAIAAAPAHNKPFSGSAPDLLNKSKQWKKEATATFSFKTSANGGRIVGFKGSYSYSCGANATLSAGYVTVASDGRFNYPFTVHFKNGTFYAEIYGTFLAGGKSAQVNYIVDFVAKGKKVRHPYDTRHPESLGCASWVRGTAKVVKVSPKKK
jgi:hypothetical protein